MDRKEVRKLRENDLKEEAWQNEEIVKIQKEVAAGKAKVMPWDIDLSALRQYGYSKLEITLYKLEFRSKARNVKF